MKGVDKLTVDVARMRGTPDAYLEPVCEGIELFSRTFGTIALGAVTNDYYLERPIPQIGINHIHFHRRTADLHAIVTDEYLGSDEGGDTLGVAYTRLSGYILGNRHTLIRYENPVVTRITTVHELGHLARGDRGNTISHCADPSCAMYRCLSDPIKKKFESSKDPEPYCRRCTPQIEIALVALHNLKDADLAARTIGAATVPLAA